MEELEGSALASACAQPHACWRATCAIRSRASACAAPWTRSCAAPASRRRTPATCAPRSCWRCSALPRPSSRCRSSWSARAPRRSRATRPSTTARRRARAPLALGDELPEPADAGRATRDRSADGLDEVAATAHRRRVRADLVLALERLDALQRAAIAAHAEGGAARAAGLPRSTYYRVLAHAQARLRSDLRGRLAGIGALGGLVQRAREVLRSTSRPCTAPPPRPPRRSPSPPRSCSACTGESAHRFASPVAAVGLRRARAPAPVPVARATPAPRALRQQAPAPAPAPALPPRPARRQPRPSPSRLLLLPALARTTRPPTTAERSETPMRLTAVIALFLLALCAPAHALAGTFVVPFGGGDADARRGLGAASRRAVPCAASRARHGVPERRDAAAPTRLLLPLQRARGTRRSPPSTTTLSYVKASAATALCAYSFAAAARRHAAALQRRDVHERGRRRAARQLGRARPLQRGRRPDRARDLPRQQRHVFAERLGDASRIPRRPRCRPAGRPGCSPASPRSCNGRPPTPRAGPRPSPMPSTAARAWRCAGRPARGSAAPATPAAAAIDLGALADGPHSLTVYAQSYADVASSVGPLAVHRGPQPSGAGRDQGRARSRIHADGLVGTCADRVDHLLVHRGGRRRLRAVGLRPLRGTRVPADLAGALRSSCGARERSGRERRVRGRAPRVRRAGALLGVHQRRLPLGRRARRPPRADAFAAPLGLVAARDGAHLRWPALTGAVGLSGIAGAYLGTGADAGCRTRAGAGRDALGGRRPWRERGGDPGRPRARGRPGVSRRPPALGRGHRRRLRKRALRRGRRAAAGDHGARRERMERRAADARARSQRRERRLVLGDPARRRPRSRRPAVSSP